MLMRIEISYDKEGFIEVSKNLSKYLKVILLDHQINAL